MTLKPAQRFDDGRYMQAMSPEKGSIMLNRGYLSVSEGTLGSRRCAALVPNGGEHQSDGNHIAWTVRPRWGRPCR